MEQVPDITFESFKLHPDLLRGIRAIGFVRPTPIQAQAIPLVMAGRDMIGCAQTGTGKTAAFVLPILHRLLKQSASPRFRVLIVAPTRELALQSMEHLKALSRFVPLKGAAIFGGVPMESQIAALAHGVDIISATPGRLLDHTYSGRIDFGNIEVVVLDEADRMLDMGFLPDVKRILSFLPMRRQNLLFSATMPPAILELTKEFLINPAMIQIGQRQLPAEGVRQALYPVSRNRKIDLLAELLRQEGTESVLVFTRTKHFADRLTDTLRERGFKVSVLHGDRSQSQRLRALDHFRKGRSQVMVATDVAARGIDIEDISHVINFDVPNTPEDYIHRIGRTARAEATGDAFTLVDPSEEPQIEAIEKMLSRTLPRVTLPGFQVPDRLSHPPRHPHHPPRHQPPQHGPQKHRRREGSHSAHHGHHRRRP